MGEMDNLESEDRSRREEYRWGLIDVGATVRYRVAGDLSGDLSVGVPGP